MIIRGAREIGFGEGAGALALLVAGPGPRGFPRRRQPERYENAVDPGERQPVRRSGRKPVPFRGLAISDPDKLEMQGHRNRD
ncbi:hypothetical protein SBA4_880042 [Candidatus Sulfopaludibacter sp. SbA4]|nr:hypothetical protein SBA4_880042 [Candidatus Sulfopaludibacter sp. SbA4]